MRGEEEVSKHGGHGQAGGKVGSEFIKDKGHKTHGFKNVYHKGLCWNCLIFSLTYGKIVK